jgi:uncharacterized repeat protein (TIGR01451 family)
MRNALMAVATAVSMAVLPCGVAVADTITTTFEPPAFHLGSVSGQNGWLSAVPGDIPALPQGYDQAVVSTSAYPDAPSDFGSQSLRHSNARNEPTGEFFYQTYAAPTQVAASENGPNTAYLGEFSFISTTPNQQQPGLYMRISPDLVSPNGGRRGARMSFIGLRDTQDGITLTFFDTDPDGDFVAHPLGTVTRDVEHKIKFWIKLNRGPDNDLVRVFIDGVDVGQCFTTWESFYPAVDEEVPDINSMQFRAQGGVMSEIEGRGYLFDNVTISTSAGPGPQDCSDDGDGGNGEGGGEEPDIDIDKTTRAQFADPGDLVRYRITVTNNDDHAVRSLRACDVVPRALRFVRATSRLTPAAGRRLCLTIGLLRAGRSRTFHATFRLRANVTSDTVTNEASVVLPSVSEPTPAPPDGPVPPDAPPPRPPQARIAEDGATIAVRRAPEACPASVKPRARVAC